MFVAVLTGCNNQDNSASVVAKNLDSNLNNLSLAVNKLDTIDNKYLYNPDIYSSLSAKNNNGNNYFRLAFNENLSTTQIANESVKQILIDKITDKLLSQNTECNKSNCYICDKYCDNDGNCYYTDCNGNNYCYNSNGECFNCTSLPSDCKYIGQRNLSCGSAQVISSSDTEPVAEKISSTTEQLDETITSTEREENTSLNVPQPNVRMFYFTQDSFSPIKIKYSPRYISKYNESTINEQIENYLSKVQKLYAMSEDSIEANTILQNCKQNIIDCISEIRELNKCIINGTCEPSVQELQALNNYIIDIKTTTQRLKDCNGELSKEINKISESNSSTMVNSVDVMNSNYLRLLNHIDTRVTYHKSAIATLEQIKYLLDNAINNGEISDEEIEEIIENFTIKEEVEDTIVDESIDNNYLIDDNVENNEEDNSDYENSYKNEEFNNNIVNEDIDNIPISDDNIISNNNILDNVYDNNSIVNDTNLDNENNDKIVNNDATNYEDEENSFVNSNNSDVKNDNNFEDENAGNQSENLNNDEINSSEDSTEINDNEITDTSTSDNNKIYSWSNVDTYKKSENNTEALDDVDNNFNEDSHIENNTNDNEDIIDNNEIIEESSSTGTTNNDAIINSNMNNEIVNNGTNFNNGAYGTTNSGIYKNSVITQNNLNNDNGYGGYYYTNDGEIKNNGINNNNEFGNNGNTIENNLNRSNNVNTYGYNTLLDIINQGTVNNGINTL